VNQRASAAMPRASKNSLIRWFMAAKSRSNLLTGRERHRDRASRTYPGCIWLYLSRIKGGLSSGPWTLTATDPAKYSIPLYHGFRKGWRIFSSVHESVRSSDIISRESSYLFTLDMMTDQVLSYACRNGRNFNGENFSVRYEIDRRLSRDIFEIFKAQRHIVNWRQRDTVILS